MRSVVPLAATASMADRERRPPAGDIGLPKAVRIVSA